MSKQLAESPGTTARPVTTGAKAWFLWMTGMWVAFFVLLQSSRLDEVATWIRDLPLVLELGVWVLCFPWVLATAVWTGDWSEGLRVTLVVVFAVGWTLISIPRRTKSVLPPRDRPQ
jgi:hypothetical protein